MGFHSAHIGVFVVFTRDVKESAFKKAGNIGKRVGIGLVHQNIVVKLGGQFFAFVFQTLFLFHAVVLQEVYEVLVSFIDFETQSQCPCQMF